MIDELAKLIEYAESKGIKVRFPEEITKSDYAGMNSEAARLMGYENIEHNEILIDGALSIDRQVANLRHEIIEKNLMKAGMKYYPAHVIALRLESVDLMGNELDALDKLGTYDISRISKESITVKSRGTTYNIKSGDKEAKKMYVMPEENEQVVKKMKPFKKIKNQIVKTLTLK